MKTMLEILNETIGAYTSKTRAINASGCCVFLTHDGKMCAIGRCLITPGGLNVVEDLESILKPEYRGYPPAFWAALQVLHDHARFWNDEGLSDTGVNHIAMQPILSAVKHGRALPT